MKHSEKRAYEPLQEAEVEDCRHLTVHSSPGSTSTSRWKAIALLFLAAAIAENVALLYFTQPSTPSLASGAVRRAPPPPPVRVEYPLFSGSFIQLTLLTLIIDAHVGHEMGCRPNLQADHNAGRRRRDLDNVPSKQYHPA